MDKHARALDVAQEGVPQTGPGAGALDEPGQVSQGRAALVVGVDGRKVEDAEVRLERRERVVGDLGVGCRQGRQEGRLAGVGQAHEADVGDEPQLQAQPSLLARLSLLGVLGRLVRRRREVRVAQPATTPAGHHEALSGEDEIGHEIAGGGLEDDRARRDRQLEVGAGLAVPA